MQTLPTSIEGEASPHIPNSDLLQVVSPVLEGWTGAVGDRMDADGALRSSASRSFAADPVIVRGTRKALAIVATLDSLRMRTGQLDDVSTDLHLLLSRNNAHHRRPVIVLLRRDGDLSAAVIFEEQCVFGFNSGLLRCGDPMGDGALIAAKEDRVDALFAAFDALLRDGRCHTLAATLSGPGLQRGVQRAPLREVITESESRVVRRTLRLHRTLDETLQLRFTKKRRRNMTYYTKLLSKEHRVSIVPSMTADEAHSALLQLASHAWPARTRNEIGHHAEFLRRHPEAFCMGLRLSGGTWLSLVTGWRSKGVTYLTWQLNHEGYKEASLMQVMRTHLIDHECALGQRALSCIGGTTAFRTACDPEPCVDFLQMRRGLKSYLIRHVLAPLLCRANPGLFTACSLSLLLPVHLRPTAQELNP